MLSKWTIVDGLILLIVLCIWLATFFSFMRKWGNFRVPLPRDIIRKFKPMNVDQIKIIDQKKENRSVIYKTYGKQIQDTMNDRQNRLRNSKETLRTSKNNSYDLHLLNNKEAVDKNSPDIILKD